MSVKTMKEEEKRKLVQDKLIVYLAEMLREEDNRYCADCDAKGPRWASWNLGLFLCIRCAGIHRNLGVHVSKVKSVNLDSWTPEQVQSMRVHGNSVARAVYEAHLPEHFRRPQSDSSMESFIRAKYDQKRYMMKDWVKPTISVQDLPCFDELQDIAKGGRGLKKSTPGVASVKVQSNSNGRPQQNTANLTKHSVVKKNGPVTKPTSALSDLVDLGGPSNVDANNTNLQANPLPSNSSVNDLLGLDGPQPDFIQASFPTSNPVAQSIISNGQPAPAAQVSATQTQSDLGGVTNEQLLMTSPDTDLSGAAKSKTDILALYSSTPAGANNSGAGFAAGFGNQQQSQVSPQFGGFQSTPYNPQYQMQGQFPNTQLYTPPALFQSGAPNQVGGMGPAQMGGNIMGMGGQFGSPFQQQPQNPQMIQQQLAALNIKKSSNAVNQGNTMSNNLWN